MCIDQYLVIASRPLQCRMMHATLPFAHLRGKPASLSKSNDEAVERRHGIAEVVLFFLRWRE